MAAVTLEAMARAAQVRGRMGESGKIPADLGPLRSHRAVLTLLLGFRIRIVNFILNSKTASGGENKWAGGWRVPTHTTLALHCPLT